MSEKEIKIYEAVFELAQNGHDLSSVKVQEIANQAKIGKGTLYEYFNSKEEIICKTLYYYLQKQLNEFKAVLVEPLTFDEIVRKGLHAIARTNHRKSAFQVLLSNSQKMQEVQMMLESKETVHGILSLFDELLDLSVELAISHGIADQNEDREYLRRVLVGSIAAFNLSTQTLSLTDSHHQLEKEIDYTVKMIYRGFGYKN